MYGEHHREPRDTGGKNGSSPRVRGTLNLHRSELHCFRFIPACAGNTCWEPRFVLAGAVHPRVCGEHRAPRAYPKWLYGSSPRVAGNTWWEELGLRTKTVHPRVCGEHMRMALRLEGVDGSSPRVRGTPMVCRQHNGLSRFIPACAGNTQPVYTVWPGVSRFIPACAGNTISTLQR